MNQQAIPMPQRQPQQSQAPMPEQVLSTIMAALLFDRGIEGTLAMAFSKVCNERHLANHPGEDTDWRKCNHKDCQAAVELLEQHAKPEMEVNNFTVARIRNQRLELQRIPAGFKARLVSAVAVPKQSLIIP
jgi:hypothetical protein